MFYDLDGNLGYLTSLENDFKDDCFLYLDDSAIDHSEKNIFSDRFKYIYFLKNF